jgi:hypothetical protein
MAEIRTHHVTDNYIAFSKPIRLETTPRTRRLFIPSVFQDGNGGRHLRGTFIHQKKAATGWEDEACIALRDLKAGDVAKFELGHEAMKNFLKGISILLKTERLASIEERSEKFTVAPTSQSVEVRDETLKPIMEEILRKGFGSRFLNELASLRPDEADRFAVQQMLTRRETSIRLFEQQLHRRDWNEPNWGKFFEENRWIFGLGLRYQFLSLLQGQATYGGVNLTGKGAQKGDFLHYTEGEARFVVLVEIKLPDSKIFQAGGRVQSYRNGVPGFDAEFANALAQVQVNSRTWDIEGSRTEANRDRLDRERIYTVYPRSLLIYGNTGELDSTEKRNCFEVFRGQLKNTEVVTYDELLKRAQFIVGEMGGHPSEAPNRASADRDSATRSTDGRGSA